MNGLYLVLGELGDMVGMKLMDAKEKARAAGALSSADIEYLDRLTHTMKSIKTTMAMMDAEERHETEEDYSVFTNSLKNLMAEAPNDQVRAELYRMMQTM